MARITKIVIHCSDSPDNVDVGVTEIRAWHTAPPPQGRGWKDIGYQYVVRRSGVIELGRYEDGDSVLAGDEIGAHTLGNNADAVGVCWVGRERPTPAQRTALLRLVVHLMNRHAVPIGRVFGHYELASDGRTCPNLDMDEIRKAVVALIVNSAGA